MDFVTPYIINLDEGKLGAKIGFVFCGLGIIAWVLVFIYVPICMLVGSKSRGQLLNELGQWLFLFTQERLSTSTLFYKL